MKSFGGYDKGGHNVPALSFYQVHSYACICLHSGLFIVGKGVLARPNGQRLSAIGSGADFSEGSGVRWPVVQLRGGVVAYRGPRLREAYKFLEFLNLGGALKCFKKKAGKNARLFQK
jgi:hypothetical protein